MHIIVSGILAACAIALAAGGAYYFAQSPVYQAQPMPSVRVGDPGSNLVGPDWSGNPTSRRDPPASARDAGHARGAT